MIPKPYMPLTCSTRYIYILDFIFSIEFCGFPSRNQQSKLGGFFSIHAKGPFEIESPLNGQCGGFKMFREINGFSIYVYIVDGQSPKTDGF